MKLLLLFGLLLAAWLLLSLFKRMVIFHYERGLLYRQGKFISIINPGVYWYSSIRTTITKVDIRLKYVSIVGQEILSNDNVSLKLSLTISYEYSDLSTAFNDVRDVDQAIYLEVQQVAREIIGQQKIGDIVEKRSELSLQLNEFAPPRLTPLGVTLKSISIKDITFSGELKKIFAEVVRAQKEGLANLERARGETAALRHLANAAKMMDGNPSLMQLRLIQSIGSTSGNTIVFGASPSDQIIPVKVKGPEN